MNPDLATSLPLGLSLPSAVASMTSNFATGTIHSLIMILITEIGDKTFFIAAVLAMRNARLIVYSGAMSALTIMHVLSAIMGYALPNLLPRAYTHFASAVLFLYFGLRLLKDSWEMSSEGPSEELQEVEEELVSKKTEADSASGDDNDEDLESGLASQGKDKLTPWLCKIGSSNFKVFSQAFTLTFLAEWGDRSQIATIALAASKNPLGVIIGGLIGHAFCTGLAVIGGRLLASKISERTVAIVGGVLFIFFAITSFLFGPDA